MFSSRVSASHLRVIPSSCAPEFVTSHRGVCFVDQPIKPHIAGSLKIHRPSIIVSSVNYFHARSTHRASVCPPLWRAPRPSLSAPAYTRLRTLLAHPLTLFPAPAAATHPAMSFLHDAHDQLAVSNAAAAAYTYTSGVLGSYRSPSATNPVSFRAVRISYGDCFARAMR